MLPARAEVDAHEAHLGSGGSVHGELRPGLGLEATLRRDHADPAGALGDEGASVRQERDVPRDFEPGRDRVDDRRRGARARGDRRLHLGDADRLGLDLRWAGLARPEGGEGENRGRGAPKAGVSTGGGLSAV